MRLVSESAETTGSHARWVTPTELARVLWPDSPAWRHQTRRMDDSLGGVGATMPMQAARLLRRLREKGLAHQHPFGGNGWTATASGRALVKGARHG